jgi:hypothetical protein
MCGSVYLAKEDLPLVENVGGVMVFDQTGIEATPPNPEDFVCMAIVKDVNGDGLVDPTEAGDEDGDGFSDREEACEWGTDPCLFNETGIIYPDPNISPPPPVRYYPIPRS